MRERHQSIDFYGRGCHGYGRVGARDVTEHILTTGKPKPSAEQAVENNELRCKMRRPLNTVDVQTFITNGATSGRSTSIIAGSHPAIAALAEIFSTVAFP